LSADRTFLVSSRGLAFGKLAGFVAASLSELLPVYIDGVPSGFVIITSPSTTL
jgi:hypothetical protein